MTNCREDQRKTSDNSTDKNHKATDDNHLKDSTSTIRDLAWNPISEVRFPPDAEELG